MLKIVRYSSSITNLWVKHNESQAIKVPTSGCKDISDLTKAIKKVLSPKLSSYSSDQLTLHPSLTDPALEPDLVISSISAAGFSAKLPLIVKIQESKASQKTIYIREIDSDCEFLDTYVKITVGNDLDVRQLYQSFVQGSGLVKVDDPTTLMTRLQQLEDGAKYEVYSNYTSSVLKVQRWQENEARAMEDEVLLSLKDRLTIDLGVKVVEYPRIVKDTSNRDVQEWDGVLFAKDNDTLYLVEAKHNMSVKHLGNLAKKINDFPIKIQNSLQPEYKKAFGTIIGVAAGTNFPTDVRKEAHSKGFKVYHVSGRRYMEVNGVETHVPDFAVV